jgi:hypothetical protein
LLPRRFGGRFGLLFLGKIRLTFAITTPRVLHPANKLDLTRYGKKCK